MRKPIILIVLMHAVTCGFGQMTFNNIELGVPHQSFKIKLQEKDFKYRYNPESETENIYSYTGKFIGKDVNLKVLVTPTTKIVWKVNAELPESNSWDTLKTEFLDLCKKMSQKYGYPAKTRAVFTSPYSEGDGNELLAISQGKCTYFYNWKTENGFIVIEIISYEQGKALINISYEDKNAKAIYSEEKDKIILDGL
jgi:hypothetical protein